MYPVALAVAVVSADVAIVNVTAPAVAAFAAILEAINIENSVFEAIAQVTPAALASVTFNTDADVVAVAVQPVPDIIIVTAKAVVCPRNTLDPVVTVMVPPAAKAPLVLVVAPNVIAVGVAPVFRLFTTNVADVTLVADTVPAINANCIIIKDRNMRFMIKRHLLEQLLLCN